jgi:4,5-DOPA dioxygenase extradiol
MNRKDFVKLASILPLMSVTKLSALNSFIDAFAPTPRMPVLFLGHGSPMNAIEDNEFVKGFKVIAKTIPKPNAILCISAHWLTNGTSVTAMSMPKTIYDFGGFPQALYDVKYPAPGSPALASHVQSLFEKDAIKLDDSWGLDHGAWSVLKHLYPNADVPIVQMSLDYSKSLSYHFELAKSLNTLRERGVLIIGSGNIVHNLGLVDFAKINEVGFGFDWAIEAHQKVNDFIKNENYEAIINYNKQGRSIGLAVPSPDHYLPLIYSLALRQKQDKLHFFNDKLLAGSLSMTSLKIG